jgi:hypothetical protein
MKALLSLALCFVVVLAFTGVAVAEDKEVTLKGKITCGKCDLKKDKACATVIVVKEGDNDVVYYFDKDSHKKHHGDICQGSKEGTVVGTVSTKDGKKVVKVTKVEFTS